MSSCINDVTIASSYWNSVLSELTNYNNLNQENFYTKGYRVVYLVRLWCRQTDQYVYKVGSSENFARRVQELNHTYDSCGRIIVVAAGIISSLFEETLIHSMLESYRLEESVQSFHKDRELYELNYDVYDNFVCMLQKYMDESRLFVSMADSRLFVSDDYMFEEDGTETMYVEDENADINMTDNLVELDCDEMEEDYWFYRRNL
jgi:hypothetical protein